MAKAEAVRRQRRRRRRLSFALVALLSGIALGAATAVFDLNKFAPIPANLMLLFPFLIGIAIGTLTRSFAQALGAFLVALLVYALVDVLALVTPELIHAHLGRGVVTQSSVARALLNGIIYVLPLTIVGLLIGKIITRGD